jgi:hypothetical protein
MLMLSGHNSIFDAGAAIFAEALVTNHHLLELRLGKDARL